MKSDYPRQARIVRWVLLAPALAMSFFVSILGWFGRGFGTSTFDVAYLLSLPAFFLNLISPGWGVTGALATLVLASVFVSRFRLAATRATRDSGFRGWPHDFNPARESRVRHWIEGHGTKNTKHARHILRMTVDSSVTPYATGPDHPGVDDAARRL
jgi:hypothetical protein